MQARLALPTMLRTWLVLLAALMLAACVGRSAIRIDYDPHVDFSHYRTYGFFEPMDIESPGHPALYGTVFREAIGEEMEARGYVLSAEPDLLINVSGRLLDTAKAANPGMREHYYGYRRGSYDAWYSYGTPPTRLAGNYRKGSVNVDMVDRAQARMVWEGVAVGRVDERKMAEENRKAVFDGVRELFAGYPFRAGE